MTVMIRQYNWIIMQAFVSKLMVGLVLAQAVSGWCCHRPCHCLEDEVADVSHTELDECCHDDHDSATVHFESHCQCHECFGFCTYVGSTKTHVARQLVACVHDVTATSPSLESARPASARLWHFAAASVDIGPPVGLHLLHKSLLI
jgi:hypothetical protein